MKFTYFFLSVLALGLTFTSCNKDDDDDDHGHSDFEYHAHINSPNSDNKHLGDTIDIQVNFEDHNGGTVHHINVRILNKDTEEVIYSKPDVAHVHDESGAYLFEDKFVLSMDNGVSAHTDWILEAKVWGHEAGEGEEISTIEFHVHP